MAELSDIYIHLLHFIWICTFITLCPVTMIMFFSCLRLLLAGCRVRHGVTISRVFPANGAWYIAAHALCSSRVHTGNLEPIVDYYFPLLPGTGPSGIDLVALAVQAKESLHVGGGRSTEPGSGPASNTGHLIGDLGWRVAETALKALR